MEMKKKESLHFTTLRSEVDIFKYCFILCCMVVFILLHFFYFFHLFYIHI